MAMGGYALGHAALAISAALLGRGLIQGAGTAPAAGVSLVEVTYLGLGAAVVKASSATLLAFAEARTAGKVADALRRRAVSSLLGGGLHDGAPRVLATIAVRIREVEGAVVAGGVTTVRAMAQLLPLALALIWLSPPLAIGGLAVVVPFALVTAKVRRRWRSSSDAAQRLVEELHTGVDDLVRNLDLWRSYGAGARIEQAIAETGERAGLAAARVDAARGALSGANEVLGALALVGALAVGKSLELPLGDGTAVAFVTIVLMAYRPLRDLGDGRTASLRGAAALAALARALPAARIRPSLPGAGLEPPCRGISELAPLELRDFGAAARGPRVAVSLEPGAILCIVGPTGSGKTTLLRALLGLEPASGALSYAGRDLLNEAVGPAHRPFAWVPQDAALVTGTLAANVGLFADDERAARSAFESVGALGLARELGDAIVGPGGRALSGGERRQVAIARALATGLPVLLLDEPTEGLDQQAQELVLGALERLRGKRSVILVTHRPEVAALADRQLRLPGAPEIH
jgi:ABC-type multidrug transport system fused ATPase/permease subunit